MTRVIRQIYLSTLVTGEFLMQFKSLAAGIALGLAAIAANAGVLQTTATPGTYKFTGTGDDTFSFTLGSSSVVNSTTVDFTNILTGFGVVNSVSINGQAFTDTFGDGSVWSYSHMLNAGAYTLTVDTSTAGLYKGNLSMTAAIAPVPEPETYAMMLAGLGALGFVGRRRKAQAK
jgi:hypothetical protein